MKNKTHWYDGWFYDTFIAPNQKGLFGEIIELIEPNLKIIDVGCGTGLFSFSVADKCSSVVGIDLSERNINKAKKNLAKQPDPKVSFLHNSITEIQQDNKQHFDYAVLTFVIHEVNADERISLLKDIASVADKIIIGDYLVPRPNNFKGKLTNLIEFVAGKNHYRNFKNYVAHGGIAYLAHKAELTILSEIKNKESANHITVLSK